MVYFITEVQGDEPDILSLVYREDLCIHGLDGKIITTILAPGIGWTHQSLEAQNPKIEELGVEGCDVYLGGSWVGSSEV